MTKKQMMMVVVIVLGIVVAVIGLWPKNKEEKKEAVPTLTPTPTEVFTSETGAKYIPPKINEQQEIDQIKELRGKTPLNLDKYEIDFDYQKNKFIVRSTEKIDLVSFAKVMVENNFGNISQIYFIFE